MLIEGRGATADPVEAGAWIERTTGNDMPGAEVAPAELKLLGHSGPRDHPGALKLYTRAAQRGYVGAMFATAAMHGGGRDVPTNCAEA